MRSVCSSLLFALLFSISCLPNAVVDARRGGASSSGGDQNIKAGSGGEFSNSDEGTGLGLGVLLIIAFVVLNICACKQKCNEEDAADDCWGCCCCKPCVKRAREEAGGAFPWEKNKGETKAKKEGTRTAAAAPPPLASIDRTKDEMKATEEGLRTGTFPTWKSGKEYDEARQQAIHKLSQAYIVEKAGRPSAVKSIDNQQHHQATICHSPPSASVETDKKETEVAEENMEAATVTGAKESTKVDLDGEKVDLPKNLQK